MRNRLSGHVAYLCGSIDDAPDGGVSWRKMTSKFLSEELNMGVLDPTDKAFISDLAKENIYTVQHRKQLLQNAKRLYQDNNHVESNRILNDIHKEMKEIVGLDFRCIDSSHIIIVYIDLNYRICGTYSEICLARIQKKPVLIFMANNQTIYDLPHWIIGQCQPDLFFNDFDELSSFMKDVAFNSKNTYYNKWKLFDFTKIYKNFQ